MDQGYPGDNSYSLSVQAIVDWNESVFLGRVMDGVNGQEHFYRGNALSCLLEMPSPQHQVRSRWDPAPELTP